LFGDPSIIVTSPAMCKKVLIDDVIYKHGYPKVTRELTNNRYLSNENERFKRHVMAPIFGYNALAMYLDRIEDIIIDKLEELSSMKHPIEFLNETRKISFEVIIHIFIGDCDQGIFKKFGDLFKVFGDGVYSLMPINAPGFSYYKALKVYFFYFLFYFFFIIIFICVMHKF
jgi:ent-kaurenoic acid monooxygenase